MKQAERERLTRLVPGFLSLIRAFRKEVRAERRLMLLAAAAVAAGAVFQTLQPWPLRFIYDALFRPQHALPGWFNAGPRSIVAGGVAAMVLLTALGAAADYASAIALSLAGSRILSAVRLRMFVHLADLPMSFHDRAKSGDLISRVTGDIDRLREVVVTAILPFLANTVTLAAMAAAMFWMNWRLALAACAVGPVFFFAVLRLIRRIREVARVQRTREGAVAATTAEAIGSMKTVQAFSLQGIFVATFSAANLGSLHAGVRAQRFSAGLERWADMLAATAAALVLWAGANQVLDGRLTPGELIVFVTYVRTAFKPLRQLAKYLGQMAKGLASGDRILDLLDSKLEAGDLPGAREAPPLTGTIRFENVSFAYTPGRWALRNVSFEIPAGQRLAVVGESGSGKSTLLSLLLRFHTPQEGRILIDGEDIRGFTAESLRRQISIVMQESSLFAASVADNIAFGSPGATAERIEEAARMAGADGFIRRIPGGYEAMLGERAATLSGGQRQRIAIARAAIRRAPVLLYDEPTFGLDRVTEAQVAGALDRLSRGKTTLLVTHDLQAADSSDRIVLLRDGAVVEQGTWDELRRRGGQFEDLLRSRVCWGESPLANA